MRAGGRRVVMLCVAIASAAVVAPLSPEDRAPAPERAPDWLMLAVVAILPLTGFVLAAVWAAFAIACIERWPA